MCVCVWVLDTGSIGVITTVLGLCCFHDSGHSFSCACSHFGHHFSKSNPFSQITVNVTGVVGHSGIHTGLAPVFVRCKPLLEEVIERVVVASTSMMSVHSVLGGIVPMLKCMHTSF